MLLAVDPVVSKFYVFRRDPATGLLAAKAETDVPNPTMIEDWLPSAPSALKAASIARTQAPASALGATAGVGLAVVAVAFAVARKLAPRQIALV